MLNITKNYNILIYIIIILFIFYIIFFIFLNKKIIDIDILENFDTNISIQNFESLLQDYNNYTNSNNYNTLSNDYTKLNTRYNQKNFGTNIDDTYSTNFLECNNLINITNNPDDITSVPDTYNCINNNDLITKQPRIINNKQYIPGN